MTLNLGFGDHNKKTVNAMQRTRILAQDPSTDIRPGALLFAQAVTLLFFALTTGVLQAATGQVTLAWDPVDDSRVARYEVHYGSASKSYLSHVISTTPQTLITGLTSGATYFFAARACSSDATLCSAFSNELSITIPTVPDPIPEPEPDPEPVLPEMTTALTSPTGTANLTSEGLSDWVHWGLANVSSITRKAGVTSQIGSLTTFGGSAKRFSTRTRLGYSWSDGTPKASATTKAGLVITGLNKGFALTAPADTTERTLVLYLGGTKSSGQLEVRLSDNSAQTYNVALEDLGKAFDRRLALTYKAASAGQQLIVRYTQAVASGSVSFQAATLKSGAPVPPGPSSRVPSPGSDLLTTPTGTVDLTAEGLADWTHWGLANATSITRKTGVTPQIGSLTTFGGNPSRFSVNTRLGYSWSDGAPKARATTKAGLLIKGLNKGFELRVPADTSDRTLILYLGGTSSRGKVEVSLSDNSAEPSSMVLEDLGKAFDRRLVIPVKAASAGQELIVHYTQVIARGSISMQAATLQNRAFASSEAATGQTGTTLESSLQPVSSRAALPAPGSLDLVPSAPR